MSRSLRAVSLSFSWRKYLEVTRLDSSLGRIFPLTPGHECSLHQHYKHYKRPLVAAQANRGADDVHSSWVCVLQWKVTHCHSTSSLPADFLVAMPERCLFPFYISCRKASDFQRADAHAKPAFCSFKIFCLLNIKDMTAGGQKADCNLCSFKLVRWSLTNWQNAVSVKGLGRIKVCKLVL